MQSFERHILNYLWDLKYFRLWNKSKTLKICYFLLKFKSIYRIFSIIEIFQMIIKILNSTIKIISKNQTLS